MSRFYSNNTNAKKNNNKAAASSQSKFCKVCFDLKKPKEEYESHYVRESPDPSSKVTCPVLLALECTYCFGPGHTVKYCKELARHNKEQEKKEQKEKARQNQEKDNKKENQERPRPVNPFAALCDDSSDSESETKKPTVLVANKTNKNKNKNSNKSKSQEDPLALENFPMLGASKQSAINRKQEILSFSSIADQVYQEQEQQQKRELLEKEEAELLAKLQEINQKKIEASHTTANPKPVMKAVFLPTTKPAVANATVPLIVKETDAGYVQQHSFKKPTAQRASLFDRSEYLETEYFTDEDENEEICKLITQSTTRLVFDTTEFDEDW